MIGGQGGAACGPQYSRTTASRLSSRIGFFRTLVAPAGARLGAEEWIGLHFQAAAQATAGQIENLLDHARHPMSTGFHTLEDLQILRR
jgi:hypothetical protein